MAQKTIKGTNELAKKIRSRRLELGLTIEAAAIRAGVGTKTWNRYEAGESIRRDKCKGICKALNWRDLSLVDTADVNSNQLDEYRKHKYWSAYLEEHHGFMAAASFAIGSEILLDYIKDDLSELSTMPVGSHIGQLNTSFIKDELPEQYLTRYDYEFLYRMKCTLIQLQQRAKMGTAMSAHSVMEELLIYLCNGEASVYIELHKQEFESVDEEELEYLEDWVFDLFDDTDILTFLYSDFSIADNSPYDFVRWSKQQFFME